MTFTVPPARAWIPAISWSEAGVPISVSAGTAGFGEFGLAMAGEEDTAIANTMDTIMILESILNKVFERILNSFDSWVLPNSWMIVMKSCDE